VRRAVELPTSDGRFRLAGSEWPLPGPEAPAEELVDRLAHAGLLVHDPVVSEAVRGGAVDGHSTRSLERRVRRATGLSRGTWQRIARAERAVELLTRGMTASEVAHHVGYADQPHLTRSLRRLMGQTPAQIRRSAAGG
jgi:methylphosphotriester-DNA--protein-cysteine methyltransferase